MSMPGLLLGLAVCTALCAGAACRSARTQRKPRGDSAGRTVPRWGADGGALPRAVTPAADDGTVPVADGGAFPLHRHRHGLQPRKFTQECS